MQIRLCVPSCNVCVCWLSTLTMQGRGLLLRGRGGSNKRVDGSESSGEEAGGRRHRGGGARMDDDVLPWLVNAKRREEEERQELRERLMGGASSKSMAASALAGRGSRSARASASTDADTPRRRSGLVEGGEEEEEGLWVSPLLKRWLTVERERLQHPSAELALASETEPDNMTAAATGEVAGTAAASAQQGIIASAVPSRAASVTTAREVEMSDVDVSSPHAVTAAATLGTGRAMSSTLDGDTEGLASAGVATPAAARKPRRRMRFVDEQEVSGVVVWPRQLARIGHVGNRLLRMAPAGRHACRGGVNRCGRCCCKQRRVCGGGCAGGLGRPLPHHGVVRGPRDCPGRVPGQHGAAHVRGWGATVGSLPCWGIGGASR